MHSKLLLLACLTQALLSAEEEHRLLSTSGSGKVVLEASIADIRLGVEVEDKTAEATQNELSKRLNNLYALLKKTDHLELNTSLFSVYPEYSNQNPPEIRGYRGKGEIVVSVIKEKAGDMISQAMQNGANRVNGIDLKATESDIMQGRNAAIQKACQQAMQNAGAAFSSLELELDQIRTVEISFNPPPPIAWRGGAVAFAEKAASLDLQGNQDVEAQVNLKAEFKNSKK